LYVEMCKKLKNEEIDYSITHFTPSSFIDDKSKNYNIEKEEK